MPADFHSVLPASLQIDALYRAQARELEDWAQFLIDRNGTVLSWNSGVRKVLGYSEEEFVGQSLAVIFVCEDREQAVHEREMKKAAEHGRAAAVRWHVRKEGRRIFVDGVLTALRDESGSIIGFSKLLRDVTDEMPEALLHAIMESTTDAIFVKDCNGRYVVVNSVAARVLGRPKEEIIGRTDDELLPAEVSLPIRQVDEAIMRAGDSRTIEEIVPEPGNGERVYLSTKASWREASGNLVGLIGIARDITERKQHEEALRRSEATVRALFENASQGIVSVNAAGSIVQLNCMAERLFGYNRQELLGQPLEVLLPERFRPTHAHHRAEYFAAPHTRPMGADVKLSARRKDGSELPVEISLSCVETKDDMLAVAFISDITKRKQAEAAIQEANAALKRSNEDLEQFASYVSHDLQAPLRIVVSYTELLAKRYASQLDSEAQEYIDYTLDAARRMRQLIRHLLAYSRLSSENALASDNVDTAESLEQALANLRGSIEESNAIIAHDPLPIVRSNHEQLIQVFQNLIGNAIKYRGEAVPQIHISAKEKDGEYLFAVKDNGIGFEPEHRERIFAIFKRLHTHEFPGSGIGLAICKRIVERQGGHIWAESTPGSGSTFFFTLPASPTGHAA